MIKFLINTISRALGFSKTESKGSLVLILIIFISLITMNYRVSYLKNRETISSDSTDIEWIKKAQASYEIKKNESEFDKSVFSQKYTSDVATEKGESKLEPSSNTVETKLADVIIKDLNSASAKELESVKGIGKVFSERIVKYRTMLGGFNDTSQLNEVYGLSEETIAELFKTFSIQSEVKPIQLNTDSIKLLVSHPYINYDLAKVIVNYRKEHGDFESIEDFRKIKALDERTFLRIKPYLE